MRVVDNRAMVHERAGRLPETADLIDVGELIAAYHGREPAEPVAFGTSGHRGTSLDGSFTEAHVVAISAAVCRHREEQEIEGPLFLGRDTHALSEPAFRTIVEVLAAHGVDVMIDADDLPTPTPVISHAILTYNRDTHGAARRTGSSSRRRTTRPATAASSTTRRTAARPTPTSRAGSSARRTGCSSEGLDGVRRVPYEQAAVERRDYVSAYVDDLPSVIDLDAIRSAGLRLGVDPLGGASLPYWQAIAERHGLDLTIVNDELDPTFRFVPLDWDGKIRMDCSSPHAMARLRDMAGDFDVAFANDPDADRHGIVTPGAGLLNPNHHLAACIAYLFGGNRDWGEDVGDRQDARLEQHHRRGRARPRPPAGRGARRLQVVRRRPRRGHARLRRRGERGRLVPASRRQRWSTDKDGLIPCLLAAEMKARTGQDPGEVYAGLADRFGHAAYKRIDVAATPEEKAVLKRLSPEQVTSDELAGEPIATVLTEAPGNGAAIGGLKVAAEHGWFAARPSGTEDVYKVYAEALDGEERLERILEEAQEIVREALS